MRYIYLISLLAICIAPTSCNDRSKVRFEITNQTSGVIDSIFILPDKSEGENYISLMPNETKDYMTDMSKAGESDGNYGIQYKLNSSSKSVLFGYYTNGTPIEKLTKINIQLDIVLFKFIH